MLLPVTHESASPTWIERRSRHRIWLRDMYPYVFCQDYKKRHQVRSNGSFEIYFVNAEGMNLHPRPILLRNIRVIYFDCGADLYTAADAFEDTFRGGSETNSDMYDHEDGYWSIRHMDEASQNLIYVSLGVTLWFWENIRLERHITYQLELGWEEADVQKENITTIERIYLGVFDQGYPDVLHWFVWENNVQWRLNTWSCTQIAECCFSS